MTSARVPTLLFQLGEDNGRQAFGDTVLGGGTGWVWPNQNHGGVQRSFFICSAAHQSVSSVAHGRHQGSSASPSLSATSNHSGSPTNR